MADQMNFPDTFDEFAEQYKIIDKKEVYTNGAELIPIFRAEQYVEFILAKYKELKKTKYIFANVDYCESDLTEALKENDKLKAEIERLKRRNDILANRVSRRETTIERLQKTVEDKGGLILVDAAKFEAYREFAEKLNKKGMLPHEINDDYAVGLETIDNLLKELVGEQNEQNKTQ